MTEEQWKALLKKYMEVVCAEEGLTYVNRALTTYREMFTEEEQTILQEINNSIPI